MLDTKLFFPEIKLKRSSKSNARQPLYSADVGSRFGRGARISLYLYSGTPSPEPEAAKLMVYDGDAAPRRPS